MINEVPGTSGYVTLHAQNIDAYIDNVRITEVDPVFHPAQSSLLVNETNLLTFSEDFEPGMYKYNIDFLQSWHTRVKIENGNAVLGSEQGDPSFIQSNVGALVTKMRLEDSNIDTDVYIEQTSNGQGFFLHHLLMMIIL